MAVDRVEARALPLPLARPESDGPGGARFADALTRWLRDANQDQVDASSKVQELVLEGKGSIHEAMVAMSNAEGSFRLLMEMRNRTIAAVNQLLQMQL